MPQAENVKVGGNQIRNAGKLDLENRLRPILIRLMATDRNAAAIVLNVLSCAPHELLPWHIGNSFAALHNCLVVLNVNITFDHFIVQDAA